MSGHHSAEEAADGTNEFKGTVNNLMVIVVLAAVNDVLDGAGKIAAVAVAVVTGAAIAAIAAIAAVIAVISVASGAAAIAVAAGAAVVAGVTGAAAVAGAAGAGIAGAAGAAGTAGILSGIVAGAGLAAGISIVSVEIIEFVCEIFHLFVFIEILILQAEVAAGSKNNDQCDNEYADDQQSPILLFHDISPKIIFMPAFHRHNLPYLMYHF